MRGFVLMLAAVRGRSRSGRRRRSVAAAAFARGLTRWDQPPFRPSASRLAVP